MKRKGILNSCHPEEQSYLFALALNGTIRNYIIKHNFVFFKWFTIKYIPQWKPQIFRYLAWMIKQFPILQNKMQNIWKKIKKWKVKGERWKDLIVNINPLRLGLFGYPVPLVRYANSICYRSLRNYGCYEFRFASLYRKSARGREELILT